MKPGVIITLLICLVLAACKKECAQSGHYIIPSFIRSSIGEKVKLQLDTLTLSVSIPYFATDIRNGEKIITSSIRPSKLYIGLFAMPKVGFVTPPIDVLKEKFFEIITIYGSRIDSRSLVFNYEATDTCWEVRLMLIPKKSFDGLFFFRHGIVKYTDECLMVEAVPMLVNTSRNFHLISERLLWNISPWENDIFFYIE